MDSISIPSSFLDLAGRLMLATLLGAAAGINRELRHKPAGLRTHALVALGTALTGIIGVTLAGASGEDGAVSRVIQGVVAGIGFIGGGVILHRAVPQDPTAVHGLTTAALIWVVAAVGIATGLGLWRSAVTTVVVAWVILTLGHLFEGRLREIRDEDKSR